MIYTVLLTRIQKNCLGLRKLKLIKFVFLKLIGNKMNYFKLRTNLLVLINLGNHALLCFFVELSIRLKKFKRLLLNLGGRRNWLVWCFLSLLCTRREAWIFLMEFSKLAKNKPGTRTYNKYINFIMTIWLAWKQKSHSNL